MPLSDLVADARASTPSMAARLVVPDLGELLARLERSREALGRATSAALTRDRERIDRSRGAVHAAIRALAAAQDRRLEATRERLDRAPRLDLERRQAKLKQTAGRLRALSPRATLERGYAIVHGPEGVVTDSGQVESGAEVSVDLARGGFGARVEETR
jgi:exodeoxyribonuclease VII large subunit